MKKENRVHHLIATVFGLGHFPFAPGTVGSLAGLVLCLFLHWNMILYTSVFLILFVFGVISSGKVEEEAGYRDPSTVVIDEFACIFVAFLFVPISAPLVIVGFILYRIFDIIKVPPMKHAENIKGGWGIMLDDLIGGVYTNFILQILVYLKVFSS